MENYFRHECVQLGVILRVTGIVNFWFNSIFAISTTVTEPEGELHLSPSPSALQGTKSSDCAVGSRSADCALVSQCTDFVQGSQNKDCTLPQPLIGQQAETSSRRSNWPSLGAEYDAEILTCISSGIVIRVKQN
jgi:hypothetical protein